MANWNCSFKKNRKQYEHPVEKEQLSEKLPNKQIANKSQPIFKSVMQRDLGSYGREVKIHKSSLVQTAAF